MSIPFLPTFQNEPRLSAQLCPALLFFEGRRVLLALCKLPERRWRTAIFFIIEFRLRRLRHLSSLHTQSHTHTLRQRRRRRRRRLRRRRRRLKASSSSSSSSLLESIDRGLWRYTKKLKNDVRRCRCRRHIEFSKLLSLLSL